MSNQPIMKGLVVRDVMVPLSRYTTIALDATLADAFDSMSGALSGAGRSDTSAPRDFAVLVLDDRGDVLGRLVVWDILQGLEPQPKRMIDGLAMVDGLDAWKHPLSNLAEKTRDVRVRDLVKPLDREERIAVTAPLDEAVHRLMQLRALSLIAESEGRSVGVLRVVDVFLRVRELVGQCTPR